MRYRLNNSPSLKRELARLPGAALRAVAARTEGFSGAELEQVVVAALYAAHAQGVTLEASHLLAEAAATRPLSVVMAERIAALRHWAEGRTVPCD